MRWILVSLGSLAAGLVSIIVSLLLLVISLAFYERYVLGTGQNEAVGWDPISVFGQYWRVSIVGIVAVIFATGCSLGFWFFRKRLLR